MLSTFNILPLLLPVVASYTCYRVDGSTDTSLTACDPSAAISPCCHAYEYCLSNGLCIGAGANNLLAVEGCTDAYWNTPCQPYCKGGFLRVHLFLKTKRYFSHRGLVLE
jgi:hypothetical protein